MDGNGRLGLAWAGSPSEEEIVAAERNATARLIHDAPDLPVRDETNRKWQPTPRETTQAWAWTP